jgi:endonuclease G, mitochondrial
VIGYPAYDSRIPDTDLMEQIYGRVYNKKRLAPGAVTRVDTVRLLHDCTTLGGNSGSVMVDLDRGEAIGLHFSGTFMTANWGVRSDVVKRLLAQVRSGRVTPEAQPKASLPAGPQALHATLDPSAPSATLIIPLTVTISIAQAGAGGAASAMLSSAARSSDATEDVEVEEAAPADYDDRKGYVEGFLGSEFAVPLPELVRGKNDVLSFDNRGRTDTVLRYEHYSVTMSKSRRMCLYSAVNIDGKQSKKSTRVAWKWDPRIEKTQQIMFECYGNPPKFSRGHMTRREDPAWGNAKTAARGNEDSMHVTNKAPQMQAFNAPIWLALEDYALGHARSDDMKISVFTGPYFANNDPTMYGVKIPRAFWKIIAFIHDDTGELCATGYEMSQQRNLPEEEFVFGAFTSSQLNVATQVPIHTIETRSGLSFGSLSQIDPLAGDDEGVGGGGPRAPLLSLSQISFLA